MINCVIDPVGLAQVLAEITNGQSTFYVPGLAQYGVTGWQYFGQDRLGSVRMLIDPTGELLLARNYDPFGNVLEQGGLGQSVFGFTGEQTDPTDLVFLRARYYNPSVGRFLTADSIIPDPLKSRGWNRYVYSYNNPVRYNDPTGHCPTCLIELAINIFNIATDNTQDATVLSIGLTGGGRAEGIGPVVHSTYDLVSNESGQIQLFYTEADGYYGDGLLLGDEATINACETFLNENASIVPQADSYSYPQINLSVTKGNANGGSETGERVGENINRYGGKSVVFSGGIGLFDIVGADAAHSFGLNDNGLSRSGVTINEAGGGVGIGLPVTASYYLTESHPVLKEPIQLPRVLIPVCQVVGQCGN